MSVPQLLAPWSSFFVMTGTSAAALTGLMFVVITLISGTERARRSRDGIATFSTPTVVHFCIALLVCAVLVAPWRSLGGPSAIIALAGLYELAYVLRVMLRTRRLTAYAPDTEDWTWYSFLPIVAYAAVFTGAILLEVAARQALFVLGGGTLLLIFIGIRNAWDVVTFLALGS